MNTKQVIIACPLTAFGATLAVVVGNSMGPEAKAVMIGIACGVAASIFNSKGGFFIMRIPEVST